MQMHNLRNVKSKYSTIAWEKAWLKINKLYQGNNFVVYPRVPLLALFHF